MLKSETMRKRTLYFMTIALLFIGANILVSHIASQTKPFTMGQILRAMASVNQAKGNQKKVLSNKILNDVRERKVDFPLTRENEALLRNEGATDELIETIRENSPPLPTPTPKPRPTETPITIQVPTATPTSKPSSADASFYIEKAKEYEEQKRYDEAIAAYTKAIEIDPKNADIFYRRGYIFFFNKSGADDKKKSINDFTDAIRLSPNTSTYYFYRALVYHYHIKDYDNAIADYDKSIILSPKSYASYDARGECYENKGNYNLAIADYKKALELKPDYQSAKDNLDRVLKKKQQ